MKTEIKIVLDPEYESNPEKGKTLEDLVKTLLQQQEYTVVQNIQFTGLEIDLLAKHNLKSELLYVECKAKEKPKSTEIKNFIYGVTFGNNGSSYDYGYFIYTEQLDKQAAGLVNNHQNDKKLSFIGPDQIIKLLVNASTIKVFDAHNKNLQTSKLILAYTYKGYYYVSLLQDGNVPTYFSVHDAKTLVPIDKDDIITMLKSRIKEINDLDCLTPSTNEISAMKNDSVSLKEVITEIKESENWYDYSPASIKDFVGRPKLRSSLLSFLENVRKQKTEKRIFYVDGNSGWGKSSIVAELRGRSKKGYWKNRMFVMAVDTRSANTKQFVSFSFKKLMEEAKRDVFLSQSIFDSSGIKITSPYEVLSDESIKDIFYELKRRKKILVLVFDQFEDIFRKEDLFEAFYKFLLQVDEFKENLVVGFSWKSESNISIGNPSYHLFTQLKDHSLSLKVPGFTTADVKKVIAQLEKSIGYKVGSNLERKLIEACQGYPWLIKKLCIHAFQQIENGKTIEQLIEEDINIKFLFDSDLQKLTTEEVNVLNMIAKKAYNETPYDISDIEDDKLIEIINSLVNSRLIIKTGTKYNIYWDIFRDYLVDKKVPILGESYLIRTAVNSCLNLFLAFKDKNPKTIAQLRQLYPNEIKEKALLNILIELRSIGLVTKVENSDTYRLSKKTIECSKEVFINYMENKFQEYTPYLELCKLNKSRITSSDLIAVLKDIFKTSEFKEQTWKQYAVFLSGWFNITKLPIASKLTVLRKGRGIQIQNKEDHIFRYSPQAVASTFIDFPKESNKLNTKIRDLMLLDLVEQDENYFKLSKSGLAIKRDPETLLPYMRQAALKFSPVKEVSDYIKLHGNVTAKNILDNNPHLVSNFHKVSSKKQACTILLSWGIFTNSTGELNLITKSLSNDDFLFSNPQTLVDFMQRAKSDAPPTNNKVGVIGDLKDLGILEKNQKYYNLTKLGEEIMNSNNIADSLFRHIYQRHSKLGELVKIIDANPKLRAKNLLTIKPEWFENRTTLQSKINRASTYLKWGKEIHNFEF